MIEGIVKVIDVVQTKESLSNAIHAIPSTAAISSFVAHVSDAGEAVRKWNLTSCALISM